MFGINSAPDQCKPEEIPEAKQFDWCGHELFGTMRPSQYGPIPNFYFVGVTHAMPREMLQALWQALHTRTKVLLNYGTADYSDELQLQFAQSHEFWKPWAKGTRQGRLYISDAHSVLMIGHCNVQTTVSLENVIAIRVDKTPDFKILWQHPKYEQPSFTLQDYQAAGKTRFALYNARGDAIKTGRTRRFAEQHVARLGGILIDDTLAHREAMAPLIGRRAVRLRNYDVDETV